MISLVSLMVLSTQLSILNDGKEETDNQKQVEITKRTAFQQIEQISGVNQVENQIQSVQSIPFFHSPFLDPFYNDPAAIYGKVSDASALTLTQAMASFLKRPIPMITITME